MKIDFIQKLAIISLIATLNAPIAQAQVIPDQTLKNEISTIRNQTIKGISSEIIEGGAIRQNNLFHSFTDFNVPQDRGVYFSNPDNITNILARITGINSSDIFGTLGVLGNANLFLINPNGISFGANANLDVRGSFVASTAERIIFNNYEFSASNPTAPPLSGDVIFENASYAPIIYTGIYTSNGQGNAGDVNININNGSLVAENIGVITENNQKTGNAGNVN